MWDNMFSDFVTYLEKKPKNLFKKKKEKKQQLPKQQKKKGLGYEYVPVPITEEDLIAEAIAKSKAFQKMALVEEAGPSRVAEDLSSDESETEVKRVPKISLKIRRPVIEESSSDEEIVKKARRRGKVKKENDSSSDEDIVKRPRLRARVKKEKSPPVIMSSSSSSESEVETSSESEELEEPVITKQLRSRTVGKETLNLEPKMSLRSRNPVVKLTRLEDEKLAYELKKQDTSKTVKEEKRAKRNLTPVDTRSSKRRKLEEVKEEPEVKNNKTPNKKSQGEMKGKLATPEAKDIEDMPRTRGARQSERTKKQKAVESENVKDDKNKVGKGKDSKDREKLKEEKRPGWEEELVAFKRSLRMPASLIKITTPPGWPMSRPSASLPDLDSRSASPLTCDSFELEEKNGEGEEKKKVKEEKTSFLNQLAQRYGATKKKGRKPGESNSKCKIIPQDPHVAKLLTPQVRNYRVSHIIITLTREW